jgi:hypothetical protein
VESFILRNLAGDRARSLVDAEWPRPRPVAPKDVPGYAPDPWVEWMRYVLLLLLLRLVLR